MSPAGVPGRASIARRVNRRQLGFEPIQLGFELGKLLEHAVQANGQVAIRSLGSVKRARRAPIERGVNRRLTIAPALVASVPVAMVVVASVLAACGKSEPYVNTTRRAPSSPATVPPHTVDLASRPELVPVLRVVRSFGTRFDAPAFLAAFDGHGQPCDLRTEAMRLNGASNPDPQQLSKMSARVESATVNAATVTVVDGGDTSTVHVRRTARGWVLAENGCALIANIRGAHDGDVDREAQSDLRNAITAAMTVFTDKQSYVAATPALLAEVEPSLKYAAFARAAVGVVGVHGETNRILLVTQSKSGTWFCIANNAGRVGYGIGAGFANVSTFAGCSKPSWPPV